MNKIVLITGASRGIGREIAKTLDQKGYQIIANYNKSQEQAQKLMFRLLDCCQFNFVIWQ